MWTLGYSTFKGVLGFQSLESSVKANYVQHALINNRQRLQRVGTDLETHSIGIEMHVAYCNPESELAKLYASMEAAKREPLSNGDGRFFGYFVIEEISISYQKTDNLGRIEWVSVSLTLLEALNPDDVANERSNSFAVASRPKPGQFSFAVRTPSTDAGRAIQQVTVITSEAARVDIECSDTLANNALSETRLPRASSRLNVLQETLLSLQTAINNTQSNIYSQTAALRSQVSVLSGATTVLQDAVDTVNLVALDAARIAFREAVADFRRGAQGLVFLKSIRR